MTTKDLEATDNAETGLQNWDEELARQAAEAAAQTASAGGLPWFSLRGGQLKFTNGAALPGNQMAAIILDAVIENVYYPGQFDPEDPQSPVCYAFSRDEKTMAPSADAAEPQAATCAECLHNQWGSLVVNGQQRRGKACRNLQRLAVVSCGKLEGNVFTPYMTAQEIADGQIGYMKVPPTSLGEYVSYVKKLLSLLKRPPRAVFTKIALEPDPKSTFKVKFSPLGQVPDELLGAIMERTKEVAGAITMSYQAGTRAETTSERGNDGTSTTPSTGKKGKRKY